MVHFNIGGEGSPRMHYDELNEKLIKRNVDYKNY